MAQEKSPPQKENPETSNNDSCSKQCRASQPVLFLVAQKSRRLNEPDK